MNSDRIPPGLITSQVTMFISRVSDSTSLDAGLDAIHFLIFCMWCFYLHMIRFIGKEYETQPSMKAVLETLDRCYLQIEL